jgi:hypothetical protein
VSRSQSKRCAIGRSFSSILFTTLSLAFAGSRQPRRAVFDTVSIGFGLLAGVHKGSQASFQRRKVNGES